MTLRFPGPAARVWIVQGWETVAGLDPGARPLRFGMLVNELLKLSYERARPQFDDPLLLLHSYSFPSGHTAAATVFYGTLAAFLVSRSYRHRTRALIVACAVGAIAMVAFSRIYLGAHYLSDVTAAVCSSTAWLVVCLSGVHALVRKRMEKPA